MARPERCLLIDGGTGSELRRRGVPLDARTWSGAAALEHAGTLTEIHADYLRAGADVITTSTFGTTRFVLEAAGLGREFDPINRAAVGAALRARESVGRPAAVAGAISCLPPAFDISAYPDPSSERAAYAELADRLLALGVDFLVLEMMEDTEHAWRACEAAKATGVPFWLGVSVRTSPEHGRLVAYDFPDLRLDDVLDALLGYAPAVVNVMHSPVGAVAPALEAIAARWSGALGAYPEVAADGGTSPVELAALAEGWLDAGAAVLGGCCGTTPEHIRALRELIDRRKAC